MDSVAEIGFRARQRAALGLLSVLEDGVNQLIFSQTRAAVVQNGIGNGVVDHHVAVIQRVAVLVCLRRVGADVQLDLGSQTVYLRRLGVKVNLFRCQR